MADLSLPDLVREASRLSAKIDEGVRTLAEAASKVARAEHDYRRLRGQLWAQTPDGTARAREAWVDSESAGLRLARDLAEATRMSALEALRSRRAQLSSVQTLAGIQRAEAELAKYGTQETP